MGVDDPHRHIQHEFLGSGERSLVFLLLVFSFFLFLSLSAVLLVHPEVENHIAKLKTIGVFHPAESQAYMD